MKVFVMRVGLIGKHPSSYNLFEYSLSIKQNLDVFFPFSSTLSVSRNIDEYAPHTRPKLSPCLFKNTAKQGHNYPILRNSSQLFLWQIIVRLIWNSNTLRLSSKSTIFKQKIHLNCPSTLKFKDRNVAHAHCSIWSCLAGH